MLMSDELGADMKKVRIIQAEGDKKYGDQNTDGSASVRKIYKNMREAAATARQGCREPSAPAGGLYVRPEPGALAVEQHAGRVDPDGDNRDDCDRGNQQPDGQDQLPRLDAPDG